MALSSARMPPRSTRYWCRALPVKARRVGELALLESPVGVQQFGALGAQRRDLGAQRVDVAVLGAAHLDRQVAGAVVGHRARRARTAVRRSSGRVRRGPRRRPCTPSCPAVPCWATGRDVHPAVVLHRAQRAVDLLVGGCPEVADGPVEPARELVSRAGLLAERHEDRVGKGHAAQRRTAATAYATCCTALRRMMPTLARDAEHSTSDGMMGCGDWSRCICDV